MPKVVSEFSIGKYKVLKLDEDKPNKQHKAYQIGGKLFSIVPIYDAGNCIAVESTESFKGKTVEFV